MKNRLFTLAAVLALLAVLGKFYARPLIAQVRAALVQDVDNPARHPYTQQLSGQCSTTGCGFLFPGVPSGKRLVIEQVNLILSPASTSTVANMALLVGSVEPPPVVFSGQFFFPMTLALPVGISNARNSYIGNLAVMAYYEAGAQPEVQAYYTTGGSGNDLASATISGHLVDLP